MRENYEQAARSGMHVPELHIKPPTELVHVWNLFAKVLNSVQKGITIQDIECYLRMTGIVVTKFEVDLLLDILNTYWSVINE